MTAKERVLLSFLERRIAETGGVPPSFDEIAAELGLASKSGVHRLMLSLERQKLIEREKGHARAIRLLRQPSNLELVPDQTLVAEVVRRFGAAALGLQAVATPATARAGA